jgi:hypothetical protein
MTTWLKSRPTPYRVLAQIGDTRAPIGEMVPFVKPPWYSSMIDVNQGYTWLGVKDVQTLFRNVKQGSETNKKMLTFIKSQRSRKLRASMRLVVSMRLQVQHHSFWLHTSSNTPSVLMNGVYGSFLIILMRKWAFHLTTFILRSTWVSWHNSGQGCNLDELANQSEPTHGLASTQRIRSHVKAC